MTHKTGFYAQRVHPVRRRLFKIYKNAVRRIKGSSTCLQLWHRQNFQITSSDSDNTDSLHYSSNSRCIGSFILPQWRDYTNFCTGDNRCYYFRTYCTMKTKSYVKYRPTYQHLTAAKCSKRFECAASSTGTYVIPLSPGFVL